MSKLSEEERMELRRKMWKDKRKQKKKEKKQRKRAEKGDGMEETAQKKPVTFDLGSVFDRILQVNEVVLEMSHRVTYLGILLLRETRIL